MPKTIKFFIIIGMLLSSVMTSFAQNTALITYDEVVTGEIDSENYEQEYTFEGQAGDTIIIQMQATTDDPRLDSFLILRDADGLEIASDDDMGGNLNSLIGPYTLQDSGTYTIVATRYQRVNGSSSGTYELSVERAEFDAITLAEETEVTLDSDNSLLFYSFTPATDDLYQLNYRLLEGEYGTDITVRDQEGNYLANTSVDTYNTDNFAVLSLMANETVNIFLRSYTPYDANGAPIDEPLTVSFSLDITSAEPLVFDADDSVTINGTLENSDSVAYYTFNAVTGQTLGGITQNGDDEYYYEFYIIVPSGYNNFYGSNYYSDGALLVPQQILTESGEYILVVHRGTLPEEAQANDEAVDYHFNLVLTATNEIMLGVPETGTVTNDGSPYGNGYIYNGQAGETITFTLTSSNEDYSLSFSIELSPQDPTSSLYTGFNANFNASQPGTISYTVTLPYDGAYIVRISNLNYNAESFSGDYEFVLESN